MTLTAPHVWSLLTAAACLAGAVCGGWRHILARDKPEAWPKLPKVTNLFLFLLVGGMLYFGVRLIVAVLHGVQTIPPNASPAFAGFSWLVALFMFGLLYEEFVRRGPWIKQRLVEEGYIGPDLAAPPNEK